MRTACTWSRFDNAEKLFAVVKYLFPLARLHGETDEMKRIEELIAKIQKDHIDEP